MLSLFPDALAYSQFAPFFLRIIMAFIFVHWAISSYKGGDSKKGIMAIFYSVVALLFFVGIFTQLASLLSFIYLSFKIVKKMMAKEFLTDGVNYYLIMLVISLSLFVLGAGHFAFDVGL